MILERLVECGRRTPRWRVVCGSCCERRIITGYPGEVRGAERVNDNRCTACDQAQRAPAETGIRFKWHQQGECA